MMEGSKCKVCGKDLSLKIGVELIDGDCCKECYEKLRNKFKNKLECLNIPQI